jgi:hypothetical protein
MEIESALAAIGAGDVLRAKPKYTRKQAREARELPETMRQSFDGYLAGDKFSSSDALPPFDYREVLDLVSAGQTPDQVDALSAAVPDKDLAMELGIEANRILAWAKQSIPRSERQSLTGAKLDDPDPEALAQFRTRWQVALDPMTVVRDVLDGSLDADQVATVALLYPSLYAEMRQACKDALVAAKMEHGKDWEPPAEKAAFIHTLLQEAPTDLALAASVQQTYAQQAQQKPKPRAQRKAPGADGDNLTPGQRAAAA